MHNEHLSNQQLRFHIIPVSTNIIFHNNLNLYNLSPLARHLDIWVFSYTPTSNPIENGYNTYILKRGYFDKKKKKHLKTKGITLINYIRNINIKINFF